MDGGRQRRGARADEQDVGREPLALHGVPRHHFATGVALRVGPGGASGALRDSGTAAVAYERRILLLVAFGPDGLVTQTELFDVDRAGDALARFDALGAVPA